MFKLSFVDIQWQAIPRLGVILIIMLAYSFLWNASLTHALPGPCASSTVNVSYPEQTCAPAGNGNSLKGGVIAADRWFQHAFDTLLVNR
jgi:hypothetical protein